MNQDATSLADLHDIVVPDPVSWWSLAPGWYVLGLLALLGLRSLLLAWRRQRIAQRYRRLALDELAVLRDAAQDPNKRRGALGELPVLLKRTALAAWPRARVAALTGAKWWRFLDENSGKSQFENTHGEALERLAYDTSAALPEQDAKGLFRAVGHWIRHHRVTKNTD